jgi:hypothetical protein
MNTVVNIPVNTSHATPSGASNAQNSNAVRPDEMHRPPERSSLRSSAHTSSRARPMPGESDSNSPFVPVLLSALALLGWLGFQTWQLYGERQALQAGYASQQQTVENSSKLRASLDALAADTQRMADGGNPNAKLLVDELKKRGITINTSPAAAPSVPNR